MKLSTVITAVTLGAAVLLLDVASLQATRAKQLPRQPDGTAGRIILDRDPQSETDLIQAELVVGPNGRTELIMKGPLEFGEDVAIWATVDPATMTYRTFKTNDPVASSRRIAAHFGRRGVAVNERGLEDNIRRSNRSRGDRFRELKNRRGGGGEVSEQPPIDLSSQYDFEQPDGSAVTNATVPCEAQNICEEQGFAEVQTWEPARWIFDVDHLTETRNDAIWLRNVSTGSISASSSGHCWANPFTFVATNWYQTGPCVRSHVPTGGFTTWFDSSTTGTYLNYNFVVDDHAVHVTASAQVQFANGMAIWGQQHIVQNLGAFNFYENWFLSSQVSGMAWQGINCNESCTVSEEVVRDCETQIDFHTWDWDQCACIPGASPIILDLDGDGLSLTGYTDGVNFDLMADGVMRRVGWTAGGARDPFLVLDRNGNGTIDDGKELFGNFTDQSKPRRKENRNGFRALAEFDRLALGGNGDGKITRNDQIWATLQLWFDLNHDGVSQNEELFGLHEVGVRSIDLDYATGKRVDDFGNVYRYRAGFTLEPGFAGTGRRRTAKRVAYDIYFSYVQTP